MFISEADRSFEAETAYRARDMAYSTVAPIPLHKEQGQLLRAFLIEVATEWSNALQKAQKKLSQLVKGGTSRGEELQGLT